MCYGDLMRKRAEGVEIRSCEPPQPSPMPASVHFQTIAPAQRANASGPGSDRPEAPSHTLRLLKLPLHALCSGCSWVEVEWRAARSKPITDCPIGIGTGSVSRVNAFSPDVDTILHHK